MARKANGRDPLYDVLVSRQQVYSPQQMGVLLSQVNQDRLQSLARTVGDYIAHTLPSTLAKRRGLGDYRINPYVLMTSASVMKLSAPARFADFIFNNKLYAGLETSFGKAIEAVVLGNYPIDTPAPGLWGDPPEKLTEHGALKGLSREEKARRRNVSVWREIDKSCVLGRRRYLVSIKSGPNCINDTQVEAMKSAIVEKHTTWKLESQTNYPQVEELDIVVGLTYGTERTTNNKENQILIKLLDFGFVEEDRVGRPGVLIDAATRSIRVYRCVGQDFWSFIGNPVAPDRAEHVFLEVLLGLAKGLSAGISRQDVESRVNFKIVELSTALSHFMLPHDSLPQWMRASFSEDELFWFATAMTAFYDEGI